MNPEYARFLYGDYILRGKGLKLRPIPGYIEKRGKSFVVRMGLGYRGNSKMPLRPLVTPEFSTVVDGVFRENMKVREFVETLGKELAKYTGDCPDVVEYENETSRREVARIFLEKRCGVCRHWSAAMVEILNEVGIESMIIYGFKVRKDWEPFPHAWIAYREPGSGNFFQFDALSGTLHVPIKVVTDYEKYLEYPKKVFLEAEVLGKPVRIKII